jgi:RNA polymerase sigma-70 factor, ECF subfamily
MVDLDETVTQARTGCPNAFNELVKETYADTYALALRLVGNADDARDVVQDTYLRAFRAISRFRGDAAVRTWLFRITSNCAHNVKRRRRSTETLTDATVAIDHDPTHNPETAAEGNELRARFMAALSLLPAKLREVVELRELADLSHDAIAKKLGITETAAKVRLHRARAKLREHLVRSDAAPVENVVALGRRLPGTTEVGGDTRSVA